MVQGEKKEHGNQRVNKGSVGKTRFFTKELSQGTHNIIRWSGQTQLTYYEHQKIRTKRKRVASGFALDKGAGFCARVAQKAPQKIS